MSAPQSRSVVMSNRPPAVIVGMELNGLGVARSLSRHGIPSIGLAAPGSAPLAATNACRVVHGSGCHRAAMIADLRQISDEIGEKTVLIVTQDEPVIWLSETAEEWRDRFHLTFPSADLVRLLMSKKDFLDLAREQGWPLPKTWDVTSAEELEQVIEAVPFPCILKPRVKNAAFRLKSPKKAFKIGNSDELRRTYAMVSQWEPEAQIQEWIGGGDDRIAFCLTYRGKSGCKALFAGRKLLQWPIECGNTAISEPAPAAWRKSIIELTEKIWDHIGFNGIGSVEYKVRPDTDEPVLIEPTVGRTDYQSEVAVLNGSNIPAMAYCDLMGIEWVGEPAPPRSIKLVDGPSHVRALRAYIRSGGLTPRQWLRLRRGPKAYMVARRNDVGPLLASIKHAGRGLGGSLLETLFGRSVKDRIKEMIGPAST